MGSTDIIAIVIEFEFGYSYLAHCLPRILQRSASVVKRWAKYLGE